MVWEFSYWEECFREHGQGYVSRGWNWAKTNRATGVTAMFQANVPDKVIQKTTEHSSIEALRSYERVSTQQHQAVSWVLMSNQSFEKELEPSKPTLAPIAPALPVQFLEFYRSLAASRTALLEGWWRMLIQLQFLSVGRKIWKSSVWLWLGVCDWVSVKTWL